MSPPTLSVVVPVHNGAAFLAQSLPPLRAALGRELLELWVVDDASTDSSARIAESLGARVLQLGHRAGPAAARNYGAERAAGDVLVFVDADVVVHPGTLERIRERMSDSTCTALFGCYDDLPPENNFASLYMNLRHHTVHRQNAGQTPNFWSGLGAVRRGRFLDIGGFDAKRFAEPSVEDIDLGNRLTRDGGCIHLDPDILGTHLKHWTLGEAFHTDCLLRALPWSRLLLHSGFVGSDLNISRTERARAGIAIGALVAALLGATGVLSWWSAIPLILASLLLSRELVGLLLLRGGVRAALAGALYHQLYYLYGSVIFGACWLAALPRRWRSRVGLRA